MSIRDEARQIIISRTESALREMRAALRQRHNPELARKIAEKEKFLERMKR